ncbi:MAG: L-serine ammonia-lyase, iron-sulfur-dependent subunit beta [Eubacteriales bacterium]|nr:L-serine ammonia-lyase, iron-sulfur-dependent subunit beta [Eubacteriales bacterium]
MPEYSAFDIIGPRMIGPSSSHTAGACRIAHTARHIAGYHVAAAEFTLYGSFAQTGRGHGTDKALIGGVLGMAPDDARIPNAYAIAREAGVQVDFCFSDEAVEHPNTARIKITAEDGAVTEVVGQSIGGGNINIVEINGLDVTLSGDYPTLIVQYQDVPGVVAVVTHILAQYHINIAFMRVFRHGRGADAYMTIETDQPVDGKVLALISGLSDGISRVFSV